MKRISLLVGTFHGDRHYTTLLTRQLDGQLLVADEKSVLAGTGGSATGSYAGACPCGGWRRQVQLYQDAVRADPSLAGPPRNAAEGIRGDAAESTRVPGPGPSD